MTQEITVLNKQVRLIQPENGFKTSIDAVLLAAACPIKASQTLLDMGCGVGSAGLCVLERVPNIHLTGIDIQESHIEIAVENAALNNKQESCAFQGFDVRQFKYEKSFHHIICNPPFLETGAHLRSPSEQKALAMGHKDDMTTKDWILNAARLLKLEGSFTIIHEAAKLDCIIQAMEGLFGAIEIIPLWPKAGRAAKRIIIRAKKGRKSPTIIHSGIILHENDGGYTVEADKILKNGEGLFL